MADSWFFQGIPFTDPLADGPTIQYSNSASITIMFIIKSICVSNMISITGFTRV